MVPEEELWTITRIRIGTKAQSSRKNPISQAIPHCAGSSGIGTRIRRSNRRTQTFRSRERTRNTAEARRVAAGLRNELRTENSQLRTAFLLKLSLSTAYLPQFFHHLFQHFPSRTHHRLWQRCQRLLGNI